MDDNIKSSLRNADQYDQMKADWYENFDPIRQVKADPKEPYNQLEINQF